MNIEPLDASLWDVAMLDDEGNWLILLSGVSYYDADSKVDRFTDQFPYAIIEIIEHKPKPEPLVIDF